MIFAQIDNGIVTGTLEADRPPSKVPEGRIFVEVPRGVTVLGGESYNAQTGTFGPAPARAKRLSKADVIGALTPVQWAEMNKFHPTALGTHAGGTAYSDPDVFWAMSVFQAAEKDFPLNDARLGQIIGRLVIKQVVSAEDAAALQAKLALVAK
jgi:hypothetical protein